MAVGLRDAGERVHRALRHLLTTRWALARHFPRTTLEAIERAIRQSESRHGGELRFAIETCLDLRRLREGVSARQRAEEAFAALRVWDTEANNGVLIYLLLADHDIEIVADRGYHGRVGADEWTAVCEAMEREFRAGRFEAGALAGIAATTELMARHFPPTERDRNELPDAPVLLG